MNLELFDMLSYARPAGTYTEHAFIEKYVLTIPGIEYDYCKPYGNWHVTIGNSRVLWSCHTDTVHAYSARQRIKVNKSGIISLHRKERLSSCLGSDDTAGVYLLRQMALRGIPGHYIFHACEEAGGKGSKALAREHGGWLSDNFDCAIALDRAGMADIITHQMYGRTASDAFAWSLADSLPGLYEPCPGIYTDTAEYSDLIAECSNLSIGYEHAHTPRETLDTNHVERLLTALCNLDQSSLVIDRLPGEDDPPIHRLHATDHDRPFWYDCADAHLLESIDDETEVESPYLDPDYAAFMREYKLGKGFS